jgi:hypothetical protein
LIYALATGGQLKDCIPSSLDGLHKIISQLCQVVDNCSEQDPDSSKCLSLLATALLTRFGCTGQWEDIQVVCNIRALILSGESFQPHLQNVLKLLREHVSELFDLHGHSNSLHPENSNPEHITGKL